MQNKIVITDREEVLKYYPKAICVEILTINKKSYHHIVNDNFILGKGKSKKNAWRAAYKNIS